MKKIFTVIHYLFSQTIWKPHDIKNKNQHSKRNFILTDSKNTSFFTQSIAQFMSEKTQSYIRNQCCNANARAQNARVRGGGHLEQTGIVKIKSKL